MATSGTAGDVGSLAGWAHGARELRWGLKRSFLDYVSGMPDFSHSLGAGAAAVPHEQSFAFPAAQAGAGKFGTEPGSEADSEAGAAGATAVRFAGELRLVAHFGALRVEFADPWVEMADDGAHLTVRDLDETGPQRGRFRLVDLTPIDVVAEGQWLIWRYQAALAAPAVVIFGGVYPVGEPFDPLAVICRRAAPASGEGLND